MFVFYCFRIVEKIREFYKENQIKNKQSVNLYVIAKRSNPMFIHFHTLNLTKRFLARASYSSDKIFCLGRALQCFCYQLNKFTENNVQLIKICFYHSAYLRSSISNFALLFVDLICMQKMIQHSKMHVSRKRKLIFH